MHIEIDGPVNQNRLALGAAENSSGKWRNGADPGGHTYSPPVRAENKTAWKSVAGLGICGEKGGDAKTTSVLTNGGENFGLENFGSPKTEVSNDLSVRMPSTRGFVWQRRRELRIPDAVP